MPTLKAHHIIRKHATLSKDEQMDTRIAQRYDAKFCLIKKDLVVPYSVFKPALLSASSQHYPLSHRHELVDRRGMGMLLFYVA